MKLNLMKDKILSIINLTINKIKEIINKHQLKMDILSKSAIYVKKIHLFWKENNKLLSLFKNKFKHGRRKSIKLMRKTSNSIMS
jgi:hypothetical protein